jgi:hypothetical protein
MKDTEITFNQQAQLEQFRSVIQVAAMALRSALIINGGASLALLTFLGNMPEKSGMTFFVCALKLYVWGVATAAIATGTSYLAQYRYLYEVKHDPKCCWGRYVTWLTIAIVFSSYTLFVLGGIEASNGFNERI